MALSPEAYLISSILRDKDYMTAVAAGLTDEMFRGYADEWNWMKDYYARYKKTPSKVTFTNHFPGFRIKAVNDTAHYADEVRVAFARRRLTGTLRDVTGFVASGDLTSAVATMQERIVAIGSAMNGIRDYDLTKDWESTLRDVEARVQRYEESGHAGVPTGWDAFDDRTGGLQPGQVCIVAARMGEGKSWALKRMAINNIIAGYPAHYASLEMSKIEVEMRVHNLLSGKFGEQVFDATGLYTGKGIDLPAYKKFLNSLKREVKGTLTISDTRGLGITEIAAHIERYKPAVYYLDYLTLAKMDSTDWQGIGVFTKQLKELAANTGTVIVAAAQLNREATKSRDVSSVDNLSGSDQIGMDADAVITMRKRSATVTEYYVAKCRQTKGAFKWYAHMDTSKGQFEEISRNKADEYIEKDREQADLDAINEQKRLRR